MRYVHIYIHVLYSHTTHIPELHIQTNPIRTEPNQTGAGTAESESRITYYHFSNCFISFIRNLVCVLGSVCVMLAMYVLSLYVRLCSMLDVVFMFWSSSYCEDSNIAGFAPCRFVSFGFVFHIYNVQMCTHNFHERGRLLASCALVVRTTFEFVCIHFPRKRNAKTKTKKS